MSEAEKPGGIGGKFDHPQSSRALSVTIAGVLGIIFGLATLYSGGMVLFVDGPARVAAGSYIPFVLWFNFLAGFFYIIAGSGLLLWRNWAVSLSMFIAVATLSAFAILGALILQGSDYEMRTVGAMTLRSVVWLSIFYIASAAWKNHVKPKNP